ncbi:MAG: DUF2141 domain-containing protein [Phaeodactylibacter sp.]|nr:DUF2141 domain-containing protein [Phaeodactylibacter sp.]MCB9272405.1 DUF2141 domain-containing protein [Lewinellaceae bacterium]
MLIPLLLCCMGTALLPHAEGALVLDITGLETARGSLFVAVYDSEDTFPSKGSPAAGRSVHVDSAPAMQLVFEGLPYGRYAVAVFHDLNGNGRLDTNALGIPTEPYAFSNNPVVKWSPPAFGDAVFEFRAPRKALPLQLKRWRDY